MWHKCLFLVREIFHEFYYFDEPFTNLISWESDWILALTTIWITIIDGDLIIFRKKLGAVGGGDDEGGEDNKEKAEEEERERLEAIREAEERRKEKHRKMEEEREKMRQDIRDKVYNS